jgi:integrase
MGMDMGKHDGWTDHETDTLRRLSAERASIATLEAALPRRSPGAIDLRARKLGLFKPGPRDPAGAAGRYEARGNDAVALILATKSGDTVETLFSARHLDAVKANGPWFVHKRKSGKHEVQSYCDQQLGRLLLGLSPHDGLEGDHISGDPLDNRDINLRAVSSIENRRNRPGSAVRRALMAERGMPNEPLPAADESDKIETPPARPQLEPHLSRRASTPTIIRARNRLTARTVETIKRPGMHGDGGGLYLHVSTSRAKSWIFRWKRDGKSHDMGLGSFSDVSLAEARDLAMDARRAVRQGGNPIETKRARRLGSKLEAAQAMTFEACAAAYIAAHKAGWRNPKHAAQWPSTLRAYVYPIFGGLPAAAIDIGLVMKAIEPIWNEKPETASRVRGRIESILDWATARGYRQGENPARWRGHLENLLPKKTKVRRVEHHAALAYVEIAGFMTELRSQEGVAARALEFAILTAARTGEVLGATWAEIDLERRLWTIPAERMKAGREHRVPLSDAALSILGSMQAVRESDHVFPGGRAKRPLSTMAFLMLLHRMGRGDLTAHGFRSTFSDWCAERTAFPSEVREMALAHAVGDKVEAAYRRGDLLRKRLQLAEAWAKFCAAPVPTGRVVSFAARR